MFGRQRGAPNLEDGARHGHPAAAAQLPPGLQLDVPHLRDDLHGDAAHGPHWPTPPRLAPSPAADEPELRWEFR